jgi:hypothetical protein
VYVYAMEGIPALAELYIAYGEEYWRATRWSADILRKARTCYSTPRTLAVWDDMVSDKEMQDAGLAGEMKFKEGVISKDL